MPTDLGHVKLPDKIWKMPIDFGHAKLPDSIVMEDTGRPGIKSINCCLNMLSFLTIYEKYRQIWGNIKIPDDIWDSFLTTYG